MRVKMKRRVVRSPSVWTWRKRRSRRRSGLSGKRRLKQYREPWMKRTAEWNRLSPDR